MSATRPTLTIRGVARAAGVSLGTVSKALNDTGTLSPETRERVLNAVRELQFCRKLLAKSLHTGLSGTVGLISDDSFGRFTMPMMEGLEGVFAPLGMGVCMCNTTDDPAREAAHVELLMAKQVDGIVVTARRSDRAPSVHLAGPWIPVDHLLSFQRCRIHRPAPLWGGGIAPCRSSGGTGQGRGRTAVALLFGPGLANPDALFYVNDQIARGTVDALREQGLRVPADVAAVGFDNWARDGRGGTPAADIHRHDPGRPWCRGRARHGAHDRRHR